MQWNLQFQAYGSSVSATPGFSIHGRAATFSSLPSARPNTVQPSATTNPFLSLMQGTIAVPPYTFHDAASTIVSEVTQMLQELGLPGPGSEYANTASPSTDPAINPETGLHKTKNNPTGTYCTTPAYAACGRHDHDTKHCFGVRGGMEGQAPWQKAKQKRKAVKKAQDGSIATVATSQASQPSSKPLDCSGSNSSTSNVCMPAVTETTAHVISFTLTDAHFRELSYAAMEVSCSPLPSGEIVALAATLNVTLLDSGTMSHLIRDRSFLWSFNPDRSVCMRTANHGTLETEGNGTVSHSSPSEQSNIACDYHIAFMLLVAWRIYSWLGE